MADDTDELMARKEWATKYFRDIAQPDPVSAYHALVRWSIRPGGPPSYAAGGYKTARKLVKPSEVREWFKRNRTIRRVQR